MTEVAEGKKWYYSKTLWFNGVMAATVAFFETVGTPIDPEIIAAIMVLGNMVLRVITKTPVTK